MFKGRTEGNKAVLFHRGSGNGNCGSGNNGGSGAAAAEARSAGGDDDENLAGQYVNVQITEAKGHTLRGKRVWN